MHKFVGVLQVAVHTGTVQFRDNILEADLVDFKTPLANSVVFEFHRSDGIQSGSGS